MNTWLTDGVFDTMTWTDWLDIGILTWLIYRGLLLVRGTRAQQSLIGLTLLAAIYVVSETLGLSTLNWVLDNVAVYIVLAVLILFQDDIRNALAQAGGTFFSRSGRRADAGVLEEVIEAVFVLAGRKIGGLVVIERIARLGPFIEGAHALDAKVSRELLVAIFHPSSPIHDGAVVIRAQRVVAAGVFLPLTVSQDVSRGYGTRHRAGIGVTETTDAICLVISEERGTVSLVQNGVVTPIADGNDLRERLSAGMELAPIDDSPTTQIAEIPTAKGGTS